LILFSARFFFAILHRPTLALCRHFDVDRAFENHAIAIVLAIPSRCTVAEFIHFGLELLPGRAQAIGQVFEWHRGVG